MKILQIKQGKTKSKIITQDNEFMFSTEVLYISRLKPGMEIDNSEFFALKIKSDKILAKQYLFNLLSKQLKSKSQVIKKLKEKGFFGQAIEYALQMAEEYNLINDDYYAQCYINTHINNKGMKTIKYELIKAGIDDNIIQKYVEGREEDTLHAAKRIADKFKRLKGKSLTRDKLYRYLYSKGFDYNTIKQVIDLPDYCEDYD